MVNEKASSAPIFCSTDTCIVSIIFCARLSKLAVNDCCSDRLESKNAATENARAMINKRAINIRRNRFNSVVFRSSLKGVFDVESSSFCFPVEPVSERCWDAIPTSNSSSFFMVIERLPGVVA